MNQPINKKEIRYIYDDDFKSVIGTTAGVMCTNSEFICIDLFIDDLPLSDSDIQKGVSEKELVYIQRRIVTRIMLQRDMALKLAEKIVMLHRRMVGGFPLEEDRT